LQKFWIHCGTPDLNCIQSQSCSIRERSHLKDLSMLFLHFKLEQSFSPQPKYNTHSHTCSPSLSILSTHPTTHLHTQTHTHTHTHTRARAHTHMESHLHADANSQRKKGYFFAASFDWNSTAFFENLKPWTFFSMSVLKTFEMLVRFLK